MQTLITRTKNQLIILLRANKYYLRAYRVEILTLKLHKQ